MIDVVVFRGGRVTTGIDPTDISELAGAPGTLLWVDTCAPTAGELELIREEFSLHPLALEDARKHGQRPKLEAYPSHAFVVAYAGNLAEVDVFVGPGWLVTVRAEGEDGRPWDPARARSRFERAGPDEATSGYLLYVILDELVDEYFARVDDHEYRIEELEDQVFAAEDARVRRADRPDERTIQAELYALRRELLLFRRRVQPLREVAATILRREFGWVDAVALVHFQDVFDHVLRVTDQLDSQRELLGNVVDAHLAIISNRMNDVMKKMTSWRAILIGSTLIAGIYGMNFEHMPELGWQYGYPFALGLMATLTIVGYVAFKRRDWL
jgi:magnesium transporter